MQSYQMWLEDDQKEFLINHILERRSKFMITMYCALFGTVLTNMINLFDWKYLRIGIIWNSELSVYWIAVTLGFLVMFCRGIGRTFGKNSDYDCLKSDQYQINFRSVAGKLPDSGKYPYYLKDAYGNAYQCAKFLDWRNARNGDVILCVELKNGAKYALVPRT